MYAIGIIQREKNMKDHKCVNLYVKGEWKIWFLANEKYIPSDAPDFGLFRFEPGRKCCYWVDPNLIPGPAVAGS